MKYTKEYNKTVIELPQPNQTRVSSCVIRLECLLQNKLVMDNSAQISQSEFQAVYLKSSDWDALEQFKAILWPLKKCIVSLQADFPSASSAALMEIFSSK